MMRTWIDSWTNLPRGQQVAIGLLAALLLIVQIDQPFPEVAWLHHVPTAALTLTAPLILRRWPLRAGELLCIMLFLALHSFGARWTYTNMPYDTWTQAVFGRSLGDVMGWHRNHYDRLVHLMFGVLAVPPFVGIAQRRFGASHSTGIALAIGFVLAAGACYELFEWGLTMIVAPEMADDYNGQQGDNWDAQKDMALAFAGALAMAAVLKLNAWRRPQR